MLSYSGNCPGMARGVHVHGGNGFTGTRWSSEPGESLGMAAESVCIVASDATKQNRVVKNALRKVLSVAEWANSALSQEPHDAGEKLLLRRPPQRSIRIQYCRTWRLGLRNHLPAVAPSMRAASIAWQSNMSRRQQTHSSQNSSYHY